MICEGGGGDDTVFGLDKNVRAKRDPEPTHLNSLPFSVSLSQLSGMTSVRSARGQRILADAITQRLRLTSCGVFEQITESSSKPVAEIRIHTGIARVL